jgi:hypothetical protein
MTPAQSITDLVWEWFQGSQPITNKDILCALIERRMQRLGLIPTDNPAIRLCRVNDEDRQTPESDPEK